MKLNSSIHEKFLFFTEPPVFSSFPPVVETLKNAEVSLECELSGTPPFEVVWYKDKRQLRSSKKYKIASKNFHASIHILNVDTSDIGEYHCKAQNEVGSDTCICTVKLKGKHYYLLMEEMAGTCHLLVFFSLPYLDNLTNSLHPSFPVQNHQDLSPNWTASQLWRVSPLSYKHP